ncbi:MAG: NAD(P)/FAD-dependent oxidoreductase [Spirochaetes bacterium]|nr:NAD(P)/FAD-dependent oxidoreductase [Spirochaetota bacterium]
MNKNTSKNAVIIGSGIGGLSSAIILLKLGYNVTVVEKNKQPGGMMRSYSRRGIDCPVGVHYLGSMGENEPLKRVFDFLEVTQDIPVTPMGLDGPIDRYIFDDFIYDLPVGIKPYEESLRAKFPKDNDLITALVNGMKRIVPMLESLSYIFEKSSSFENIDMFAPIEDLLSQYNCSPELRGVLDVPCSWMGISLSDCPVFYHHIVLLSYIFSSWKLKCTGAEMADVFASKVKEFGGKIITGDQVDKILIKDRIVKGVLLISGNKIESEIIIAAIHPQTMLKLIDNGDIKPAYRNRVTDLKNTMGIFSANYTIDANKAGDSSNNFFRLKINDTGYLSDLTFFQVQKTAEEDLNMITLIAPSRYEDWTQWKETFTGRRGNDYLEKKNQFAEKLLSVASDIIGPFIKSDLIDTYTPLSIRDWVYSPHGSTYGIERSRTQLLKTASLHRTSVHGLHLAGQNVLAPGILGTVLGSLSAVKGITGDDILEKAFFK